MRGLGRTGSLRNGTDGIVAGDWEVNTIETLDLDSRIMMYPLDRIVINETLKLSEIDKIHDRQIVAAAIALQKQDETVVLLSCDRNITAFGVVQLVW